MTDKAGSTVFHILPTERKLILTCTRSQNTRVHWNPWRKGGRESEKEREEGKREGKSGRKRGEGGKTRAINLLEGLQQLSIVPRLQLDGLSSWQYSFQHFLTLLPLGVRLENNKIYIGCQRKNYSVQNVCVLRHWRLPPPPPYYNASLSCKAYAIC